MRTILRTILFAGGTPYVPPFPAPTVASVSPTAGALAGGTAITITGANFVSGATVTVGGVSCTSVVVVSATSITCVTGVHAAGATDIVVTNPDTQSGTGSGLYTYQAAPTVTSVAPSTGATAGGIAVTVTGTGFLTGATVTIGGVSCTSVTVTNSTTITCTTGAHALGTVNCVVTNTDNQSGTGTNVFTYQDYTDTESVNFDGTDDYGSGTDTAVNSYFAYNAAWTHMAWVKFDSLTGERTWFSTRDSATGYRGVLFEALNDGILIQMLNAGANGIDVRKASQFSTGTWYHIAIVYTGSSAASGVTIYKNGTALTSLSVNQDNLTGTTISTVAAYWGNDRQTSRLDGLIGDNAVFNKALNATEITEAYNGGNGYDLSTSSMSANLVGWWLMGDGSSDSNTTIFDQIGSTDITLNGGANITADAP